MRTELLNILSNIPNIETVKGRKAILFHCVPDNIIQHIDIEGSPYLFASNLINTLVEYDQHTLFFFLENLRSGSDLLFPEQKEQLNQFCFKVKLLNEYDWKNEFVLKNEFQTSLENKLTDYAINILNDPEFSEWEQRRYFELQLGKERSHLNLRVKLKSPSPLIHDGKLSQKFSVKQAIDNYKHLVIIGDPGSGKTTTLKHIALEFAVLIASKDKSNLDNQPLPIYVWLPRFNNIEDATSYERIVTLIRESFFRQNLNIEKKENDFLVQNYTLLLLLDGLNEIGEENINGFLDGLKLFLSLHQNHKAVITSRTLNFQFGHYDMPILEILEMEYPKDIQQYLSCYITSLTDIKQIMHILETKQQIRQLAVNPLLLLLIILVYKRKKGKIPNSRAQLLNTIAVGLLGEWSISENNLPHRNYWKEDKLLLLQHLGIAMKTRGLELTEDETVEIFERALNKNKMWFSSKNPKRPQEFAIIGTKTNWQNFLYELKSDRLLLQTRDPGTIRFWHQTIQEYFAALFIWNQIRALLENSAPNWALAQKNKKLLKLELKNYIDNSTWHEILALVPGLIECPEKHKEKWMILELVNTVWKKDKLLAAMCLNNIERTIDEQILATYIKKIAKDILWWGLTLPRLFPWLILSIMMAIIWLIPDQMIELFVNSINTIISNSGIIILPLYFFLGLFAAFIIINIFYRTYNSGLHKLEILTNERFIRPGILALRYIRNDAAERVLSEFNVKVSKDFAIGEHTRTTIKTGLVLPVKNEYELIGMLDSSQTRLQAIERLAEIGSDKAIIPLKELIQQSDIDGLSRASAIRTLARIIRLQSNQNTDDLASILRTVYSQDQNEFEIRKAAYHALIDLGITQITPPQQNLRDFFRILTDHWYISIGTVVLLILLISFY